MSPVTLASELDSFTLATAYHNSRPEYAIRALRWTVEGLHRGNMPRHIRTSGYKPGTRRRNVFVSYALKSGSDHAPPLNEIQAVSQLITL